MPHLNIPSVHAVAPIDAEKTRAELYSMANKTIENLRNGVDVKIGRLLFSLSQDGEHSSSVEVPMVDINSENNILVLKSRLFTGANATINAMSQAPDGSQLLVHIDSISQSKINAARSKNYRRSKRGGIREVASIGL